MTCTGGGNIFNYLEGICEVRHCEGDNYMLSSARGGWDIYILDVARLTADTATMLPGSTTSGQEDIDWIPIAVPIVCVCILIPVVVVIVLFVKKRKRGNPDETVTYDNAIQTVNTTQGTENQKEMQKQYYGLKSRHQPEPSQYNSMQAPIYEQVE